MPTNRHAALLVVLLAASFARPAAAETWRCGSTYTDRPCENGRAVATEDRRSGTQQRDADAAARSAQSAADRMAQERLRLERSATGRQAVLIAGPAETATPKKLEEPRSKSRSRPKPAAKGKQQGAASEHFTAQGPGTGVKKKAAAKTASADKS